MPHQRHQSTGIAPRSDGGDVAIVNPTIAVGHVDMDEVVAVDGRVLARGSKDILGLAVVPTDIGNDRRERLHAIVQAQVLIQLLGIVVSGIVSQFDIANIRRMIDVEGNALDVINTGANLRFLAYLMDILLIIFVGNAVVRFQ